MKKGQGFSHRITLETLKKFLPILQGKREKIEDKKTKDEEKPRDPALDEIESEFDGESFTTTIPFTPPKREPLSKKKHKPKKPSEKLPEKDLPEERGPIAWEKPELPPSDVQRQKGHPIGGVRLSQANYRHQGQLIDHTKYFRHKVFGEQNWEKFREKPLVERAIVKFDIIILGKSYGINSLIVLHKPSGEAGQRNYTTILTWRHLGRLMRDLNLIRRKFTLYKPREGTKEPFFIEIS